MTTWGAAAALHLLPLLPPEQPAHLIGRQLPPGGQARLLVRRDRVDAQKVMR